MTKFLYPSDSGKPESPSVVKVRQYITPVAMNTSCLTVLELFFEDSKLYALPVTNSKGVPVALVERQAFVEFFGRPFTRELHGKKTILQFISSKMIMNQRPIIVDVSTSTDDVARIIIDRGMQHMVSGFIVTEDGYYAGVANGHSLLNEITQHKQAELYYLAHYDQLTGVPNRMLFSDRLTQACREAARKGAQVGLMFVDLDRFKQVNDSLGHSVGDHLLCGVVQRLQSSARDCDTVARLGGDEFAILLDGLKDPIDADVIARRIIDSLQRPFTIMGHQLFITASLGIAIHSKDDDNIGSLLTKADAAMYEAKRNGRNDYRVYEPGFSMYSFERMSLETDLRNAIDNDEFVLFYQPQVNLVTGQVIGVEALIRWEHPKRGLLSPAHFIQLAEDSGLIVPIGNWVLRNACRQIKAWGDDGLPPMRMAVNVSAIQFHQVDFCGIVKAIIHEIGVDPSLIELELTESIVMHHSTLVLGTLEELKKVGVMLAIDDFGTGFSSLSYLRRFPIDCLKIDQSFIRDIELMPVNEAIVRAIIALAQSLSLDVVAEGIETEAELTVLKMCHCTEAQGYHYLRPLPADDFVAWLADYRSVPRVQSVPLLLQALS
jgi:diguanylate cyclase (GGDEF)-like protein